MTYAYSHKEKVDVICHGLAGNTYERATIVRARRGINFLESKGDAKCGDGFRIGKYQHHGEFIDGVWYIVKFADGGALAIHETNLLPVQREAIAA